MAKGLLASGIVNLAPGRRLKRMQPIEALLFEPVGCLAEFPSEPFLEIAARLFGRKKAQQSGSRAYWHLLNLIESSRASTIPAEALELEAVNNDRL